MLRSRITEARSAARCRGWRPRRARLPLIAALVAACAACGPAEVAIPPDEEVGSGGNPSVGATLVGPGVTVGSSGGGDGGGGGAEPVGPACGDSVVNPGEQCDDGNTDSADGCTALCTLEAGWACLTPGDPCVYTVECGDGFIGGAETCDDQNLTAGDGCSDGCQLEPGWVCPFMGAACVAAACGDAIIAGQEDCDDGNDDPGDGCSVVCQVEPGFVCGEAGDPCVPTVCGDGVVEGSEQCDQIDEVTGLADHDLGDGCGVDCRLEPICVGFDPCTTVCGDALRLPGGSEECDDGNILPGDGCAADCTVEPGYACEDVLVVPDPLVLPYVVRDFSAAHEDMERPDDSGLLDLGLVEEILGDDGKPVYAAPPGGTISTSSAANFDQWYRDVPGVNFPFVEAMLLEQLPGGEFELDTAAFFPLENDEGFGDEGFTDMADGGTPRNFHFTSEVRYWFEFKGTESFAFRGDDDVWVFVNKQQLVDLGGTHGPRVADFTLSPGFGGTLSMEVGNVYEIVVFQAERHTFGSNYRLTLGNFENPISVCSPVCGDGIETPYEACDLGEDNDGSYGGCNPDCTFGPRCGDGELQPEEEECDDGANVSPYDGCAPGCQLGASCGDGAVDSLFGEQCDDGDNDGGYGECSPGCVLGPYCGDGEVEPGVEQCDDGNSNDGDDCRTDCTLPGTPN